MPPSLSPQAYQRSNYSDSGCCLHFSLLLLPHLFLLPSHCSQELFFWTLTATAHLEESDFLLPTPAVGHRANNQTASLLLLLLSFLHFCWLFLVVASPCYLCKLRIYNITFKFSILAFKTPDGPILSPDSSYTAPPHITPPLCCSHHQQSQHIPCPQRLLHTLASEMPFLPPPPLGHFIPTAVIATTVHWRLGLRTPRWTKE